jgi:hypothetical protein
MTKGSAFSVSCAVGPVNSPDYQLIATKVFTPRASSGRFQLLPDLTPPFCDSKQQHHTLKYISIKPSAAQEYTVQIDTHIRHTPWMIYS